MSFWRNTKINWPFWVFGLITIGIILSVGVLIFNLATKAGKSSSSGLISNFDKKADQVKEDMTLNYKTSLTDLVVVVQSKEKMTEIKPEIQKIFLAIRVPKEYLDVHLQTWLKIDQLGETNFKAEVLSILKELQFKVK